MCGETVLGHLTDLYNHMYDACRKDGLVVFLQKDHLKFTVLAKRGRRKDYSTGEGLYLYIQQRQPRHGKLDIFVSEGKAIPKLPRPLLKRC